MEINKLTADLLKSMRGKRSQNFINQRLGYHFNQMSRWETGRCQMPWQEFVRFSGICRVDLRSSLRETFGYLESTTQPHHLIKHLIAHQSRAAIGARLDVSRHTVGRWISGQTSPSLQIILSVVNAMTPLLLEFIESLTDLNNVASLKKMNADRKLEKRVNYQHPYLGAVLRCLETAAYAALRRHKEGYISDQIGISREEEKILVKSLLTLGILELRDGKMVPHETRIDTRGNFEGNMHIRKYWLNQCLAFAENLKSKPDASFMGHLVFSVSEKARLEIEKKYFDFFQQVRTIVETDNSVADDVHLLNIQLLSLTDLRNVLRP